MGLALVFPFTKGGFFGGEKGPGGWFACDTVYDDSYCEYDIEHYEYFEESNGQCVGVVNCDYCQYCGNTKDVRGEKWGLEKCTAEEILSCNPTTSPTNEPTVSPTVSPTSSPTGSPTSQPTSSTLSPNADETVTETASGDYWNVLYFKVDQTLPS